MRPRKKTKGQRLAEAEELSPRRADLEESQMRRKQAEEALRESEEKYRALVESSPNLIAIYQDGAVKYANDALCRRLGWTFEEMTSPSFNGIEKGVSERYQTLARENIKRRLGGEEIPPYEIMVRARDGSEIPCIVYARRISYQARPAEEVILVDISERKKTEEALRKSEMRFRDLVDLLPEAVYEMDLNGKLAFANQRAFDLSGYTQEDLDKGINAFQLLVLEDRDRAKKNVGLILTGEELGSNEYTMVRRDGLTVPVVIHSAAIIHDGKPVGLRGIIVDITERKKAEQALRDSERKLSEQNIMLQEKNIALREVMEQLRTEKERIGEQVRTNVDQLLLPLLTRLKDKGSQLDRTYIDLLDENLRELTSSFGSKISIRAFGLTQKQIEICNMIRSGLTSKEIAILLNVSYRTVETHRNAIRKKLGITNRGVNLTTYLKAL